MGETISGFVWYQVSLDDIAKASGSFGVTTPQRYVKLAEHMTRNTKDGTKVGDDFYLIQDLQFLVIKTIWLMPIMLV